MAWAIFDGLKPMVLADLSKEVLLAVKASVNEETSITPSPESAPPAKKAMKAMKSMKAAKTMKATTGTAASTELTDASKEELREKHKNIGCSKCRKKGCRACLSSVFKSMAKKKKKGIDIGCKLCNSSEGGCALCLWVALAKVK